LLHSAHSKRTTSRSVQARVEAQSAQAGYPPCRSPVTRASNLARQAVHPAFRTQLWNQLVASCAATPHVRRQSSRRRFKLLFRLTGKAPVAIQAATLPRYSDLDELGGVRRGPLGVLHHAFLSQLEVSVHAGLYMARHRYRIQISIATSGKSATEIRTHTSYFGSGSREPPPSVSRTN